jgi:HAD superfamily hydrolase (TIGR01549 family)
MRSARAVFLDLDATILDYDDESWLDTVHDVCDALARSTGDLDAEPLARTYTEVCLSHWRAAEGTVVVSPSGSLSGFAIWREHWQSALAANGHHDDRLAELAVERYTQARAARYRLFDDVVDCLAALRDRVDSLAVITNGPGDTQRHKVAVTGLDRRIDTIVISGEVGVAKPDPAVFELAARRLGLPPAAAWHVGDSLDNDIAGARAAGLGAAVWLNRTGASPTHRGVSTAEPDHVITSLRDLVSLI